tara:strand:- start:247 stop:852 length:606 start_codon:yes stop_codon:yes gene_type:complete
MEATRVETGYHNLQDKDGWSAVLIETDKQTGFVPEFIEKEGKWFNNIKGLPIVTLSNTQNNNLKTEDFAFQGVGKPLSFTIDSDLYPIVYGCMRPSAPNYNPLATVDDGSCSITQPDQENIVYGCTKPEASNYNPDATHDDGSCILVCNDRNTNGNNNNTIVYGCTDSSATNYDPNATVDDGSCLYPSNFSFTVKDTNDAD